MSDINRPPSPKQRITPYDLLAAKRISDLQIHPDGERIAFVLEQANFEDSRWNSHIWITEYMETCPPEDLNTENEARPEPEDLTRRLTYSHEGESKPRWSPDGRSLAFLSAREDPTDSQDDDDDDEEDPKTQIWLLPMEGGEARKITSAKEGVLEYEWLPDGETLIYMTVEPRPLPVEHVRRELRGRKHVDPTVEMEDRRPRQLYRMGVHDSKPVLLYIADCGTYEFSLSPDGSRLCYATSHTNDPNDYHLGDIYLIELSDSGASSPIQITERSGGKGSLRWSSDGCAVTFLSWLDPELSYSCESLFGVRLPLPPEHPDNVQKRIEWLDRLPLAPEVALLTDYDYDITDYAWSAAEGCIYALTAYRTGSQLARIANETTTFYTSCSEDRAHIAAAQDHNRICWVQESREALPEIVFRDENENIHILTRLNASFSETHLLPRQEVVEWISKDGTHIEGVLTYPLNHTGGKPCPLALQIHGGPKGRSTNTLRSYLLHPVWAAEGYAVLRPNYRGSEGYGHAFAISNRRDLGGGDYEDIMAGVEWAIAQGIADPNRLGVMGGSYGGYMTNWIISHSNRFKAACSLFGIFHLQTDYSNSSFSRWDNDYLGAYYWEDPEIYRRLSPGTYVDNINTPTLIMHGDDDDNTFISNSKEMFQALRHRGVTTEFVHYPREGHGMSEPNHRQDEVRRCLSWMDKHLLGNGEAQARHRIGDTAVTEGWILSITSAERVDYVGLPSETEHKEPQRPLEVTFTLNSLQPPGMAFLLPLANIRIDLSGATEPLQPIGIPTESHGTRLLLQGDNLHLNVSPDAHTGHIAFAASIAFHVSESSGSGVVRIASFPGVEINWSAETEDEKQEGRTDV